MKVDLLAAVGVGATRYPAHSKFDPTHAQGIQVALLAPFPESSISHHQT
jgi:hypothetical protein